MIAAHICRTHIAGPPRTNPEPRVALARADASLFQRFPAAGTPAWTVYRVPQRASFVELPERGPAS
jgi:hypothetical protein